jgi:fatty-acyl-CoA synthase
MHWLWLRRRRTFFIFEGRHYTYGEVYAQAQRYARLFLAERGRLVDSDRLGGSERLSLGIYMDNTPEFVFAALAAGLSNSILFAINTGSFRGETLAKVIDQAGITRPDHERRLRPRGGERASGTSPCWDAMTFFLPAAPGEMGGTVATGLLETACRRPQDSPAAHGTVLPWTTSARCSSSTPPVQPAFPRAVPCTHIKLVGAGFVVESAVRLTKGGTGATYPCRSLHSNGRGILGIPAAENRRVCSFVLKQPLAAHPRLRGGHAGTGVSFLNYVGQPLHYIVRRPGEEVTAAARRWTGPWRTTPGTGSAGPTATALQWSDRKKLMRYLNMEHIFEIYGSTEAVITTANLPGDPIDSVGKVPASVMILDEQCRECEPGVVDAGGRLLNYDQAVGEICSRVDRDNLRFEGYLGDSTATSQKFRDGIYHSGDLGHIRVINRKRYLFFNGRTDDWIRKDGENFSAENVLQYAQQMPGVDIAVAYGAPCDVSDEKVMVAVQMKKDAAFDPEAVHAWFMNQQKEGGMDPKWMPDFIRVIDSFPVTDTHKIVVRPYKKEHYNIEAGPGMTIYYRTKGDETYHPLSPEKYRELKACFVRNGRENLLG